MEKKITDQKLVEKNPRIFLTEINFFADYKIFCLEFEASAKRFFAESKLLTKSKHLFNFKRDDFVKLDSFISSELSLSHINIAYCISSNMYLQMPLET